MIHKLFAGQKGKWKKGLSLLLCLALLGSSLITTNVTAADTTSSTIETTEESSDAVEEAIEAEDESEQVLDEETEEADAETADEVTDDSSTDDSSNAVETADESTNTDDSSDESDESSSTTELGSDGTPDGSGDSSTDEDAIIVSEEGTVIAASYGNAMGVASTEADSDTLTASSKAGNNGSDNNGNNNGNNDKDDHKDDKQDEKEIPSTIYVWYDRVTASGTTLTAKNDNAGIASVTLNGSNVPHGNGGSSDYQSSTSGLEISSPYSPDGQTVSVKVTPSAGYYVTFISVNCCGSGAATSCETYRNGGAYTSSFTVSSAGAITCTITLNNAEGFHHQSEASNYFILICVEPIPSPLYVEYDYGEIVNYINNSEYTSDSSAFASANGWTSTSTQGNEYGSGYSDTNGDGDPGVKTANTQYKYAYTKTSSDTSNALAAAAWKHYANTITDNAKKQAAAAGYVFAGWYAEYYTEIDVSSQSGTGSYQTDYNKYYYDFSGNEDDDGNLVPYATAYYDADEQVPLTTNVRLTALWIPIGIQIEKTVSGLPSTLSDTYTIELQKYNDSTGTWETISTLTAQDLAGGGTSTSSVIYPISSGLYQVVETSENGSLSDGTTTYYLVSTTGETTTITVPEEKVEGVGDYEVRDVDGTEVAVLDTLTFTNTYSDTQEYMIVEKTFVGLTENEIGTLLSNFAITISSTALTEDVVLTAADRDRDSDETGVDDDDNTTITWRWKVYIEDANATYTYSESGADAEGYTRVSNPVTGSGTVDVSQSNFTIAQVEEYSSNSSVDFDVEISGDNSIFFAASLTGNYGFVVITATPLSTLQKAVITRYLQSKGGNWVGSKGTGAYFFNLVDDKSPFILPNGEITYEDGFFTISATNVWKQVLELSYNIETADIPEISITNTYTPDTTTLTVTKTVTGNMGDTTKDFDFTLALTKESDSYQESLPVVEYTGNSNLTELTNSGESYSFTLKDGESITITVPYGYSYELTETGAASYKTYINEDTTTDIKTTEGDLTSSTGTIVNYVNDYTINPDTGINLDSLPYILMLAGVAVIGGVVLFRRRRKLL